MAPLIRALSIRIPRQCGWRFGPIGTSTTTSSGAAASIAPTLWPRRRGLSSSAVVQQLGGAKSTQPAQGKIGVAAAVAAASGEGAVKPTLWDEFALRDRVALVSGANRGLGLEMALALVEAGARAVYCVDLPKQPGDEWTQVAEYVRRMETVKGRLEYVCADVTDQKAMWKVGEDIGEREGRMDVCVAAAGILKSHTDCLEYPANQFEEVIRVNTNGVLYTAQAAGRQMARFGNGGSIILIASMSGSITNKDHAWVSYNTSKSAVLQMARSMACELGPKRIRVNTLSPGHIYTSMTAAYLDKQPHLLEKWSKLNPLGRIGRPDELRGVITWLASDASTFCTGSDILVSGGHHAW
jgi:NAD(P)-dependent dehydrogenase (short-subunit alcohol dehydrogenase family)